MWEHLSVKTSTFSFDQVRTLHTIQQRRREALLQILQEPHTLLCLITNGSKSWRCHDTMISTYFRLHHYKTSTYCRDPCKCSSFIFSVHGSFLLVIFFPVLLSLLMPSPTSALPASFLHPYKDTFLSFFISFHPAYKLWNHTTAAILSGLFYWSSSGLLKPTIADANYRLHWLH